MEVIWGGIVGIVTLLVIVGLMMGPPEEKTEEDEAFDSLIIDADRQRLREAVATSPETLRRTIKSSTK